MGANDFLPKARVDGILSHLRFFQPNMYQSAKEHVKNSLLDLYVRFLMDSDKKIKERQVKKKPFHDLCFDERKKDDTIECEEDPLDLDERYNF